ncbi:MAG: carbohydrate kinase family protein [Chloroflexota bacterium]
MSEQTTKQRKSPATVLSIGEALIDLIPAGKQPVESAKALEIQIGGAPLNLAVAITRLGGRAIFCGALSEDQFGSRIAKLIEAEGIAHIPRQRTPALTRLAVVDHTQGGSAFRFYGENPADSTLEDRDVQNAMDRGPGALYCGSLLMAHPRSSATQRSAIRLARDQGVPIITDPNPRAILWPSVDVMRARCLELVEASSMAKMSIDDLRLIGMPDDPFRAIERLSDGIRVVVITDGANGCWANLGGRIEHVLSPPEIEAIDPTGAGDAFMGALALRFVENARLEVDDLKFASYVGATATTRPGAISSLPVADELMPETSD